MTDEDFDALFEEEIEMTKNITITQEEYNDLMEDIKWLRALENAGVDNWEGYEVALELLKDAE